MTHSAANDFFIVVSSCRRPSPTRSATHLVSLFSQEKILWRTLARMPLRSSTPGELFLLLIATTSLCQVGVVRVAAFVTLSPLPSSHGPTFDTSCRLNQRLTSPLLARQDDTDMNTVTAPTSTTRPEEVPAVVASVASHAAQWRTTPLTTKIDLLRRVLANTQTYADEWTALAQESRGVSPTRSDHGCARADVWIGGPATMGSYLNGLIAVLEHCEGQAEDDNNDKWLMPPPPTNVRTVPGTGRAIATVWPRTMLDRLEAVGLKGELVLDDEGAEQMSLEEAYGAENGGMAGILGAGNVDAPIELLCELFLKSRVCVYKPNPVNALQGRAMERILQPLVEAGCLDFVHGGADVGAALVADPTLDEVVLTGTASTYDKIRPLVSGGTNITAELGGVNAWIVVPGKKWNKRSVDNHARHVAFARLANNGHVCAAPQVVLVDEQWPWREQFMDRLRFWMAEYGGSPPFYPGSDKVHSHFQSLPGAELIPGDDAFVDQQRPVLFENVSIGDEEGDFGDILSREAFCPVISEVPLPSVPSDDEGDDSSLAFLRSATKFAEDNCFGSLTCNILIPDNIVRKNAEEFDSIVAQLPFGIVGVNLFPAFAHSIPQLVWGAPPGHLQSGCGFIGNAGLYRRPQKAVLRAPFNWIGRKCLCVMPPKKTEKVFRRLARYKMRPTPLSQAMLFSALFLNF